VSGSPWKLLGIARTADEGEIRRAYARALKAIDVDADPQAFIALREALDAARMHAARVAAKAEERVLADGALDPGDAVPEPASPGAEPELRPQWMDDIEAIQALVYGDQPREAIFEEVGIRAERLLNGPEMEEVDHAARIEQWAVQVILSGIPRSNGLLLPAIQRFGWLARAQQWDCHPAIRAVIDRYADCQFVNDLRDGKGLHAMPFRQIYRGVKPRGSQAAAVAEFLALVRGAHPSVLHELPADSLAAWEALIEKRDNWWTARARRTVSSGWAKFLRFSRRYRLDYVWRGLFLLGAIMFGLGLVVATHGLALIFLVPALLNANKK
jgi:hypothetical protein